MSNHFDQLMEGVAVRTDYTDGHSETLTGEDSPTGQPVIFINSDRYTGRAHDKMVKAEALHLLKYKKPELHAKLYGMALRDPEYMAWARRSYDIATGAAPDPETGKKVDPARKEDRPFNKWHEVSRFDQVIGGYILAQDPDLPTMRNWSRPDLPIGPELRGELEKLRQEFNNRSPSLSQPPKVAQKRAPNK